MIATTLPAVTPVMLDEFVRYLERDCDTRDSSSLQGAMPMLARLLRHPRLITDALDRHLVDLAAGFGNRVIAPSIPLATTNNGFAIRANVWNPKNDADPPYMHERAFVDFETPHNHDFDFITGGYVGPGYTTSVYSFHGDPWRLSPGDSADLSVVGDYQLTAGTLMFYERSVDVHAQTYPAELSISLQVMTVRPGKQPASIYGFDVDAGKVCAAINPRRDAQIGLLAIAERIGDDRTMALMEQIAERHPHQACRQRALQALSAMTER